jgi:hypothetical protein
MIGDGFVLVLNEQLKKCLKINLANFVAHQSRQFIDPELKAFEDCAYLKPSSTQH